MTISEKILNRLQEMHGANYELKLENDFNKKYTNPITQKYDNDAFDSNPRIPVLLKLQSNSYKVVPYVAYETNYDLIYYVPINDLKIDAKGVLLEEPAFNVLDDIQGLQGELRNKTIVFEEPTAESYGLRGKMTYSEPIVGDVYDETSNFRRTAVIVRGLVNATDLGTFASDRVLRLGIENELEEMTYYDVEGYISRSIGGNREGVSVQKQGTTVPLTNGETIQNVVSFSINITRNPNPAIRRLIDYAQGGNTEEFYIRYQLVENGEIQIEEDAMVDAAIEAQLGDSSSEFLRVDLQRRV